MSKKLATAPLDLFLTRCTEVWTFFFGRVLPLIQASFLPLSQLTPKIDTYILTMISFQNQVIWPHCSKIQEHSLKLTDGDMPPDQLRRLNQMTAVLLTICEDDDKRQFFQQISTRIRNLIL